MKILVEANWDEEARVWVAEAVGDLGIVTEAPTIEELQRKLAIMVPEMLEERGAQSYEIDLVARISQTVAA